MGQFQPVAGPSQDEFNSLSGQVTALNNNLATKAKHIVLESGDNTWAKIWAKINTLSNLETATFYSTYQATTVWGGGVKSVAIQGTISRVSASQFEIIGKYATNNLVCIRLTNVSSSSAGTYSENDITGKLAWTSRETIETLSYGTLYGIIATGLGLACLIWAGNGTAPSASTTITLPAKYTPSKSNFLVVVRNGDNMEVRTDGKVNLNLDATKTWSGATVTYPL